MSWLQLQLTRALRLRFTSSKSNRAGLHITQTITPTQTQSGGRSIRTKTLGRYIVADSTIGHGEPTFRGTVIMVADVLEQLASGMAWDAIIEEWCGTLTRDAIAEAVCMARGALVTYAPKLIQDIKIS
jgi:uncharacterized protein (DUF433 family)